MSDGKCTPAGSESFEAVATALRADECATLKHDTVIDFLVAAHRRELQEIADTVKHLVDNTRIDWSRLGRSVCDGDDAGSIVCEFETQEQAETAVGCVNAVRRLQGLLSAKGCRT